MENSILIYGAYGYTGKLITKEAVARGHKPLLAGRNPEKLVKVAQKYDLPYEAFSLGDRSALDKALAGKKVVINAAGPYSKTAELMVEACIRNNVHYLDVTGEIEVFEYIATMGMAAKAANIILLPGTGFDVVPSDCLAAFLKTQLPDAKYLELAFLGIGQPSRGTTLTMLENIHKGGNVRENHKIIKVPFGHKSREVLFGERTGLGVSIPWGDVSTAYYSTSIPNITVYMGVSESFASMLRMTRYFDWFLGFPPVQNMMASYIKTSMTGPSEEEREKGKSFLWGEVRNEKGEKVQAKLKTPDGYSLTSATAVRCMEKVLENTLEPGFYTPSKAFGADFILEFEGASRSLISEE